MLRLCLVGMLKTSEDIIQHWATDWILWCFMTCEASNGVRQTDRSLKLPARGVIVHTSAVRLRETWTVGMCLILSSVFIFILENFITNLVRMFPLHADLRWVKSFSHHFLLLKCSFSWFEPLILNVFVVRLYFNTSFKYLYIYKQLTDGL